MHAEPHRNSDGNFIHKHVTFKIYEVRNGTEYRSDAFNREQVRALYISRTDNRSVKLQIQNKRRNGFDAVCFVFENVYKAYQFAALLSIKDDYPNYRPIGYETMPGAQAAIEESKVNVMKRDLKILSITWNMGGSDDNLFQH